MEERKVACPNHRKKTQNLRMRFAMRASTVLVPFFQGLITGAYRIRTVVQKNHLRLAICHRCIQRFVPNAKFTFAFIKDHENYSERESECGLLWMYADITDDIPFTYIEQSCPDIRKICSKLISDPRYFVPEEDRKLVTILKKTARRSDKSNGSPRGIQKYSFDLNIPASDDANNHFLEEVRHSKTYCLRLEKNIPELWILGCLRCLDPGDKDKRSLVSKPSTKNHQWELRYTTFETQEDTMIRCGNSCGTIKWNSDIDCRVSDVGTSTQGVYSYSDAYHDTELKRKHSDRSINNRHAEHIEAPPTKLNDPLSSNLERKQILSGHFNFKSSHHTTRESKTASSIQEWSSPYHCVHHSFSLASRLPYERKMHTRYKKVARGDDIPMCSTCLMAFVDSEVMRNALENPRLTSERSALLFFSSPLHAQNFAIKCAKICNFFTGLSEIICAFLQDIEKLSQEYKAILVTKPPMADVIAQKIPSLAANHSLLPVLEPATATYPFTGVVSDLRSESSEGSVWFLQFAIREVEDDKAFKHLAFCIAAVSNTYVVSSVSRYIITSPFEYSHVLRACEEFDIIDVIFYKNLAVGFDLQPMNFEAVAAVLDLSWLDIEL